MGNFFYYPLKHHNYSYHREEDYNIFGERKNIERIEKEIYKLHNHYCQNTFREGQIMDEKRHLITGIGDDLYAMRFPALRGDDITDLKCQFEVFDLNRDGLIDLQELNQVLDRFGDTSTSDQRLTTFRQIDADNSGAIDFEEFLVFISKMKFAKVSGHEGSVVGGISLSFYDIISRGVEQIKTIRRMSVYKQLTNGVF